MFPLYITLLLIPGSLGSALRVPRSNDPLQAGFASNTKPWIHSQISVQDFISKQEPDEFAGRGLDRRAPTSQFPYPVGLSDKRITIDKTCTQDSQKRDKVADALMWIPELIKRGQEKSKEMGDIYKQYEVKADGEIPGPQKKLKTEEFYGRMPDWPNLFGDKGLTHNALTKWAKKWVDMSNVLGDGDANTKIRITCHDSIEFIGETVNQCDGGTQAVTFPKETSKSGSKSYEKDPAQIVNLCKAFFDRPKLSDVDDVHKAAVLAHKAMPNVMKKPQVPTYKKVNTGARILLHEFTHLKFTMDIPSATKGKGKGKEVHIDYIDGENIKKLAEYRGFTTTMNTADQNAYFAIWAYYAPQEDTLKCEMWPSDDMFT